MKTFNKILVVSRSSKDCPKVFETGVALARQFDAKLFLMHVLHDPFSTEGWNIPFPYLDQEYKSLIEKTRQELSKKIKIEKDKGLDVTELVKDGEPDKVIIEFVKEEQIDLIIMLAHEEGRLEHFLFGKTNDNLIRKIPASILMCKCKS